MVRKSVSILTCAAFLFFEYACTHIVQQPIVKVNPVKDQGLEVRSVLKKSGEVVNFAEERPGRIEKDAVVGESLATTTRDVAVPKANIKSVSRSEAGVAEPEIQEIKLKGGLVYRLKDDPSISSIKEEGDHYIVALRDRAKFSVPFSEIDSVLVKRPDSTKTFLAVVGVGVLAVVAAGAIAMATKESCPFIYSYDGQTYVFDAEPYGGATSVGLKRTEWCGLEHLKDVNGIYRIRVTNEVDETQQTDELKLVVVDHAQGVKAVPDESGNLHTITQPIIPVSAREKKGRDILPLVQENDWIFWQSWLEEKSPSDTTDIRDELVFEFPKPLGATKAKLFFNGCNTLWASQMVKRFLELYGEEVTQFYAAVNAGGAAYQDLVNWNLRGELYRLQIRAETKEGWVPKGTIVGGGPFISEDRIYSLDLGDIPGETLKLKLLPPAGFWMINYIAVDYTDDLPVQTTELAPVQATDRSGRDIRGILSQNDEDYFIMPNIGDWADVSFLAPPSLPGLARTVLCKASGFYDIHLEAKGKPRQDILGRFLTEPDFAARYALQEYVRWAQENLSKAKK